MQYSDDAKTEFKFNSYQDKGVAMAAPHHIRYKGGNTKTGQTRVCFARARGATNAGHAPDQAWH